MTEKDIKAEYLKPQQSADKLKDGTRRLLQRFGLAARRHRRALRCDHRHRAVPIDGPEAEALVKQYAFFAADEIPDGAYKNVAGVKTVSVNAIWATSSKQPDQLIYNVTAALWNPNTRKLLDSGHAKGRAIKLETAVQGLGIPLHAGAEKFYQEKGLIKWQGPNTSQILPQNREVSRHTGGERLRPSRGLLSPTSKFPESRLRLSPPALQATSRYDGEESNGAEEAVSLQVDHAKAAEPRRVRCRDAFPSARHQRHLDRRRPAVVPVGVPFLHGFGLLREQTHRGIHLALSCLA